MSSVQCIVLYIEDMLDNVECVDPVTNFHVDSSRVILIWE